MRFLHIATVKCNQMCTCDRVKHQYEDAMVSSSGTGLCELTCQSFTGFTEGGLRRARRNLSISDRV